MQLDPAHALRRAHQSRVGTGAAQEVLPLVQLRAAGRRNRQRHRHLAHASSTPSRSISVFEFRQLRQRRARADAGDARRADVHGALALERDARAGDPALPRRPQGAAADPAHARRRSDGGGLPRSGGVRRKSDRADPHSRSRLVRETIDNCLHEAMDLDGLLGVLRSDRGGDDPDGRDRYARAVGVLHEILNANPYAYLDDAPLEERRARAVQLRRTMRTDADAGAACSIRRRSREVAAESWPLVRDADELHDALLTLVALPPVDEWRPWYETLEADRGRRRPSQAGRHVLGVRGAARPLRARAAGRDTSSRDRAVASGVRRCLRRARPPSRKSCAAGSSRADR